MSGREIDAFASEEYPSGLPRIEVNLGRLGHMLENVRVPLATSGIFYARDGSIVRIIFDKQRQRDVVQKVSKDGLICDAGKLFQLFTSGGKKDKDVALHPTVANGWLETGFKDVRPLDGICHQALVQEDGSIHTSEGYHEPSRLFCTGSSAAQVSAQPSRDEAEQGLRLLRGHFKTFCFAEAETIKGPDDNPHVDLSMPPGRSESTYLHAVLTAAVRASLPLAPGFLIAAPSISGSGCGKTLLGRAVNCIATGLDPTITPGVVNAVELDKQIVADMFGAPPCLFIDNLNGMLDSRTVEAMMTSQNAVARVLGQSKSQSLPSVFVLITGNGLRVPGDAARRFLECRLESKVPDAEARVFSGREFYAETKARRLELLAAALTIWRWGRQNAATLKAGRPMGSFETWCQWVRDPLLTLGCADPVEGIAEAKANDPTRDHVSAIFQTWWHHHKGAPIPAARVHLAVQAVWQPIEQKRSSRYFGQWLGGHKGTEQGGFKLHKHHTRKGAPSEWYLEDKGGVAYVEANPSDFVTELRTEDRSSGPSAVARSISSRDKRRADCHEPSQDKDVKYADVPF